jgi:hypothetical protein
VRPSGTEPKLKFYCQLLPGADQPHSSGLELLREIRAKAEALAQVVYNDLLACIGLHLDETGLLLPDIVDLDQKMEFERHTVPQLHEALARNRFTSFGDLLDWLQKDVAAMTPGADPLPALKSPIGPLCRAWTNEGLTSGLLAQLSKWAEHDQR